MTDNEMRTRALEVVRAGLPMDAIVPNNLLYAIVAALYGERDKALEEASRIADEFECKLGGYESDTARDYYDSGVDDARAGISAAIRKLAREP